MRCVRLELRPRSHTPESDYLIGMALRSGARIDQAIRVLRPITPYYAQTTDTIQSVLSAMLATARTAGPYTGLAEQLPQKLRDALAGR